MTRLTAEIDEASQSARSVESDTSVTAGPRRFTLGVPQGFARSRQGALAAASSYLCTGQTLLHLAPTQVKQAVDLMTAAGSSETQVAHTSKQLVELRATLADGAGPTQYLQAVLTTRIDAYTSTRAHVSMWNVGVLSRRNSAPPQAGWSITTYDLVWEHDDWKVWSEDSHAGPAPMLNGGAAPATADELAEQLDGFQFAQAPS